MIKIRQCIDDCQLDELLYALTFFTNKASEVFIRPAIVRLIDHIATLGDTEEFCISKYDCCIHHEPVCFERTNCCQHRRERPPAAKAYRAKKIDEIYAKILTLPAAIQKMIFMIGLRTSA